VKTAALTAGTVGGLFLLISMLFWVGFAIRCDGDCSF
jgi:hypothetical protein